jgi:hypothetical protein
MSDFWYYVISFSDKWLFWIGTALLFPEIFKRIPRLKERFESLPHKLFWGLALLFFFLASFQVWHEQREKSKEGAVYVRVADITVQARIGTGEILFPGEPIHVNVSWTVFGQKPALNVKQHGKAYLIENTSSEAQARIVKDSQIEWEEAMAHPVAKEFPPLFPGEHPEVAYMTYAGPVISQQDRDALQAGQKFIAAVGAIRFSDSLGEHESHVCRWVQFTSNGDLVAQAWHVCNLWVSPIEITK